MVTDWPGELSSKDSFTMNPGKSVPASISESQIFLLGFFIDVCHSIFFSFVLVSTSFFLAACGLSPLLITFLVREVSSTMNLENSAADSVSEAKPEIFLLLFMSAILFYFFHRSCAPPLTTEYSYYCEFTKGVKPIRFGWNGDTSNSILSSRDDFDPLLTLSFNTPHPPTQSDAWIWTVVKSFFLFEFDPQPSPSSTSQIMKGRLFDCYVITLWDDAGLNYIGAWAWHDQSIEWIGVLALCRSVVGVFYSPRPHVKINVDKETLQRILLKSGWMLVCVTATNLKLYFVLKYLT